MKKLMVLFLAVVLGTALLAGCASLGTQTTESDVAAIKQVWVSYVDSAQKGDAARYLALWDTGGIQMRPDAPSRTKADLDAQIPVQMKARVDAMDLTMTIDVQEITVSRPWAYSRGVYTQALVNKATKASTLIDGKFLTILKLQEDGSWKIFRDCFNSNVPPK
jgi:ketosteroid isomerase-like protein